MMYEAVSPDEDETDPGASQRAASGPPQPLGSPGFERSYDIDTDVNMAQPDEPVDVKVEPDAEEETKDGGEEADDGDNDDAIAIQSRQVDASDPCYMRD